MKRAFRIALLIVLAASMRPAPAEAGFWAWLEEWSGPGPFKGYTFMFTACVQDRTLKASPIGRTDKFHARLDEIAKRMFSQTPLDQSGRVISEPLLRRRLYANPQPINTLELFDAYHRSLSRSTASQTEQKAAPGNEAQFNLNARDLRRLYLIDDADHGPGHNDPRLICGYVDQGFFKTAEDKDRGFPSIRAHLTDIGPSARIHDGVDLGVGFGWVAFDGTGVDAPPHLTLTPIRLILRPFLLAAPEEYRKRWMGVLTVYWKETFVIGRLSAADFGSSTDSFSVDGELIRSFGFNADITALLPQKWGLR